MNRTPRRQVLECASPLALSNLVQGRKSGRGLPQSKTLARQRPPGRGSWSQCMHKSERRLSHPRQMRNPGDMFIAAAVLLPRRRMARDANGVCATRCRVRLVLCGLVLALGCAGCGRSECSSPGPHRGAAVLVTFDVAFAPVTFE